MEILTFNHSNIQSFKWCKTIELKKPNPLEYLFSSNGNLEDLYFQLEKTDASFLDVDTLTEIIEKARYELNRWVSPRNFVLTELNLLKRKLNTVSADSTNRSQNDLSLISEIKKQLENAIYSHLFFGI